MATSQAMRHQQRQRRQATTHASARTSGNAAEVKLDTADHKPVWCVRHNDGWCATFRGRKPDEAAAYDRCRCDRLVMFRSGEARRLPTCAGCRAKMRLDRSHDEAEASAAIGKWLDQQQDLGQLTHDRYNAGKARRGNRTIAMAEKGTADRIVRVRLSSDVVPGLVIARPVALEVKRPGESVLIPTRFDDLRIEANREKFAQFLWLQRQSAVGVYCCCVHSLDDARTHIARARAGVQSPGPEQWGYKGG